MCDSIGSKGTGGREPHPIPHVGFRVKRLTKSCWLGTGASRVEGSLPPRVISCVSCVIPLMSRLPMIMACHKEDMGTLLCCKPSIDKRNNVSNLAPAQHYLEVLVFWAIIFDRLQRHQHGERKFDSVS